MNRCTEFVSELAKGITDATTDSQWDSVRADLTAVSDQLAQALIERRDHDVSEAYGILERAYSNLVTRHGLDDNVSDIDAAASELRAYLRLLSVAMQYRNPLPIKETALNRIYRPLLDELLRAPNGLSGRELAAAVGAQPETIARKLPTLRSAGLVQSQQVGKATINSLTSEGRKLLLEECHGSSVEFRPQERPTVGAYSPARANMSRAGTGSRPAPMQEPSVNSIDFRVMPRPDEAPQREWFVIDATDAVLGRLASQIAKRLRGKHKRTYTPDADTGELLVVTNVERVRAIGNAARDKRQHRVTSYGDRISIANNARLMQRSPDVALQKAVKDMLPRGQVGNKLLKNLRIFSGSEHPDTAQRATSPVNRKGQ